MIDLDNYIPLEKCDKGFVSAWKDKEPFDYLEYSWHYFEPDGIYILFTYSKN